MSVSCECCVLSGRGLCVGLITSPEESCRVWVCPTECDRKASIMRRPWPTGAVALRGKMYSSFKCYSRFCLGGPRVEIILGRASAEVVRLWKGSVIRECLRTLSY
jgi:hypothetical protein